MERPARPPAAAAGNGRVTRGAGSATASNIDPGSPWQNPYVDSFGSRVRDELLSGELLFETLIEAQVMVADWREDYNHNRPHSSLGMRAPTSFAREWREGLPVSLQQRTDHRLSQQVDP